MILKKHLESTCKEKCHKIAVVTWVEVGSFSAGLGGWEAGARLATAT